MNISNGIFNRIISSQRPISIAMKKNNNNNELKLQRNEENFVNKRKLLQQNQYLLFCKTFRRNVKCKWYSVWKSKLWKLIKWLNGISGHVQQETESHWMKSPFWWPFQKAIATIIFVIVREWNVWGQHLQKLFFFGESGGNTIAWHNQIARNAVLIWPHFLLLLLSFSLFLSSETTE